MQRIRINIKSILKLATKYTALIFAILGYVATFAPLDEAWRWIWKEPSLMTKVIASTALLCIIWLALFVWASVYICRKKCCTLLDAGNDHYVYVQYGDVFSGEVVRDAAKRRNIVIPVNCCFDTIIDDDLISSNSLHGQAMRDLYEKNLYTEESLSLYIQEALRQKGVRYQLLTIQQKRKGNQKRYPVGTVVEVPADENKVYFFLALSKFDKDLHANTPDDAYVQALIRLILFYNKRSQSFPLVMPLVGGGAADTKKSEKDILEYLAKLWKMQRNSINSDVHIVVRNSGKDSISIVDI